jgi:hypothetical protein
MYGRSGHGRYEEMRTTFRSVRLKGKGLLQDLTIDVNVI